MTGTLAAIALAGAVAALAALAIRRLWDRTAAARAEGREALPLVVLVVALLNAQYLGGFGLLALSAWIRPAALGVAALGAAGLVLWLRRPRREEVAEPGRGAPLAGAGTAVAVALAVAGLVVAATMLRTALMPPLDWDFLTYHGPKAAFWAQTGSLDLGYDAPGVWQFYAAVPIAGNVLTAWSVLLLGSDALVSTTWLGTGLAGYVAARTIGASVSDAALGAAVALTVPAAFHHMGSGSVDNLVAAALMALVAGFAASSALALALMPAHRTDYLAEAAAGQHVNSGPINLAPPIGARAFWTGLDRMEPRTVAVTAGSPPTRTTG